MWEKDININETNVILCKSNVYFGVGAIEKIDEIVQKLTEKGIKKVIVVSGKGAYKITGAWDYVESALKKYNVGYVNFAKCTPNPTTDGIDEATKLALEFGADAVIGIGGGSAIDTCKSVAILMKYPDKTAADLYEYKFTPKEAAPIVAINLTHGTGTEANRFAVATLIEKDYKPAIAYASPYTITLARETIKLVAKYLPIALNNPEDVEARYYLLYASLLGGICFDNGLLHYTHALEHPLSAIKHDLSHGLGLAMLLPSVIKNIYPKKAHVLADILAPIVDGLEGKPIEAKEAALGVQKWLKSVGVSEKLADMGFKNEDLDKLADLAFTTPSLGGLLAIAPTEATKEAVREIYETSMTELQ